MLINIYESENTRNWFRYETFYYLFEFKEERETQFLSMLTFPSGEHFVDPNWSRLGKTKNRLPSPRLESQLTGFFPNSKILSVIHVTGLISYLGFL